MGDSASKGKPFGTSTPRARTASNATSPNPFRSTPSITLDSPRDKAPASKPPSALRRVAESGDLRGANCMSTPTQTSRSQPPKSFQTPATPTTPRKASITPKPTLSIDKRRPTEAATSSPVRSLTQPSASRPQKIATTSSVSAPALSTQNSPKAALSSVKRGPEVAVAALSINKPTQDSPARHRSVSGVKRALDAKDNDEESEDEGGDIRTSQRRRKRSKPNEEGGRYAIGYHIDEPLLTIYAKLKAQSPYETVQTAIIFAVKTPDLPTSVTDIRWNELVYTNSQVPLRKVLLSSKVLSKHSDKIEDMSNDRKLTLIKEYLFAKKKQEEYPDDGDDDEEDTLVKYSYLPEYLEVGHHVDDDTVPVQAHVRLHASNVTPWLTFKVFKEDGKRSKMDFSLSTVKDLSKIKFKPEFEKASIEGTKMEIFSRFTRNVARPDREDSRSPKPVYEKTAAPSADLDRDSDLPASKTMSDQISKIQTSDEQPEPKPPGPKRASHQLTKVLTNGEDFEAGDTIVVHPRRPTIPTYNALATASVDIQKAMLSLHAAEGEISEAYLKLKEEKQQFSKDKSVITTKEEAVKRKAKANQELEARVAKRESDVEKLEIKVKARETAVENLELELKVREEAIGTFETSKKEESNVTKEKEKIKAEQAKLATFRSDLEKEKSSLRDMRSAWKNEQESSNKALEEREDALAKRKTSIEEMDQSLKKRKDDILKREEDFNVKQQTLNALDTLSSLTDAQVMEFIQKNPIAQRIIRNNISKRATKETETFKTEHAKEIKLLEEREQRLKQREEEFAKKEAALTSVHPNTPIRLAAPATASQGTPQLLGQFGLVIPLPLLAKNCSFEEQYRLIPAGMPNAGMYMRQSGSRELTLDGKLFRAERFLKEYTLNQIVTNPTIAVDGVKLDKITQHGGYEWENYVKDDKLKLVQKFSTTSCVFDRSRVFVSWHVYKQIEDVPDFTI